MSDSMSSFDTLLNQAAQANAQNPVNVPEGWGQGRATFGGLVAALVYAHMEHHVSPDRQPRSLSLSFVGPVTPGPVTLETEILREGRGVTQAQSRLIQDGQVQAVMLGSFGASRESSVCVDAEPAPAVKAPADCIQPPKVPGITPEFMQYLDYRWGVGSFPYSGTQHRDMGGWVRFAQPQQHVGIAHLLALADAWPPAVLPRLKKPAPASSLCWTIEFIHPLPELNSDDWLLYVASIDHAQNGYGQTQARLWSPKGELLALSRQTITVFG